MAGRRQLPPVDELVRQRRKGMTHREIADWWFQQSGEKVTVGAISTALSRAGHSERNRYEDLIPWRVAMKHQKDVHVMMLRAEGRRRTSGDEALPERFARQLSAWKAELEAMNAVVHYRPERGFLLVTRREGIDTDLIRVPICPECGTESTEKCKHDSPRVRVAS